MSKFLISTVLVADTNLMLNSEVVRNFYRERKVLLSHKAVISSTPILTALIHYWGDRAGSILYIKCSSLLSKHMSSHYGMDDLRSCAYITSVTFSAMQIEHYEGGACSHRSIGYKNEIK